MCHNEVRMFLIAGETNPNISVQHSMKSRIMAWEKIIACNLVIMLNRYFAKRIFPSIPFVNVIKTY